MSTILNFQINLEIPFDMKLDMTVSYYPGTPDKFYLSNGDPGYPGEPPEIEINQVWILAVKGVELSTFVPAEELIEIIEDRDELFNAVLDKVGRLISED